MRNKKQTSNVGEGIISGDASWTFGGDTPKTFTAHVKRSVPFYDVGHDLIIKYSDFFVKEDSICYELGVSTGALISELASYHNKTVRWIGLDIQSCMIKQAKLEIKNRDKNVKNIQLIEDNIVTFDYEPSDLILSYYTVQFIPPRLRQTLINKIYNSLNWGGAFIIFEKVRGPDARFQDMAASLYTDFKLKQGYTAQEIISKSKSLKRVLEPFSTQGNIDIFKRAGFVDIMSIFKYICFEGFVCIK